jgi:hypothetical protein
LGKEALRSNLSSMKRISLVIIAVITFMCIVGYIAFWFPIKWRLPIFLLLVIFLPVVMWLDRKRYPGIFILFDKGLYEEMEELQEECSQGIERGLVVRKSRKILRSLSKGNIISIDITFNNESSIHIEKPELIEEFKKHLRGMMVRLSLKDAIAKYGDEMQHFKIEIHSHEGTYSYVAVVHPKSHDDLILMPPKQTDSGGTRLRGLNRWLDENVFGRGTVG